MRAARLFGFALLAGFTGVPLALASPAGGPAARPAVRASSVTMTGEIVDPQCYFTHDARGTAHAACATRCARGGQGLAFLEERTGKLYPLIARKHGANQNDEVLPHVGKRVSVRGVVFAKGQDAVLQVQSVAMARNR